MKVLMVAILCTLSLSAFAEGTYECHLKTGRQGAHESQVAGALIVTQSQIVFSTNTSAVVFAAESREIKKWRGNSWIEYAVNQADINTTLSTDSEESMEKITIESMRGQTLVKLNTYLCFQTH